MNILVTGAAGRLGRRVCRELMDQGHTVRGTDITVNPKSPVRIDVQNILDREVCYRLCEGMEVVIHLANHTNEHYGTPQKVYGENMVMNMNVFQAAVDCGVKKLLFASSIQAISGRRPLSETIPSEIPYFPIDGDMPGNPGNPYALSKVHAESLLRHFAKMQKISTIAIRYPGLVGNLARMAMYNDGSSIVEWSRIHGTTGDEAFVFLTHKEAARFTRICVEKELPGYNCFLPAFREPYLYKRTVSDLKTQFYPSVPWRNECGENPTFANLAVLQEKLGWSPPAFDITETDDSLGW
ncbi:MAG: NAD(P)-dependent oxidoreductase [Verrucomicrobiota bacterium]|nr:NAD(P)-dependent oxidoreductase [Verrucomicrobiota bacterium]